MRILLAFLTSMSVFCATAQTHLPVPVSPYGSYSYAPLWSPYLGGSMVSFDQSVRKWQLKPYASISAGVMFFNGATTYVSAPVGVAAIRPLNNNLAAFGNVSVAPTIFSLNRMYYNGSPINNLNLNSRIEGGLIYTNDARTFSISGSVSVERGGYPVYPSGNRPANHPKSVY